MKKEKFIRRMSLIQNFMSEQETLNALIDKLTDGYSVVTIGDYLVEELIEVTEEELHYKDILSWWLYENVEKVIYDQDQEISVRTLDELYDFIQQSKDNKKAEK